MTDITELAVIPAETALQVFTVEGMIDPYLSLIRREVDEFVPDLSTKKGRDAIASFAYKLSKCKTQIDAVGKEQTDLQKEIPKKIDAVRKRVRDTLDAWKDEVREPLDMWEAAEAERQANIKAALEELEAVANDRTIRTSETIRDRLAEVKDQPITRDYYGEYLSLALEAQTKAIRALESAYVDAVKREKDAAELEQLRAERAAREQKEREEKAAQEKKEREEQIAKAAAEAAERKAKEESEAAAKKAKADLEAAQRREEVAKAEAEEAKRRAEKAEQDAKEKAERDHRAKLAAEEEAARKREANKKHRAKINNAILAAFVTNGIEEYQGKAVIELIAKGQIPHVSIGY